MGQVSVKFHRDCWKCYSLWEEWDGYIGRTVAIWYKWKKKKKKKEFIAMNATHLHEVDYCLDGILQSGEKDSLITFNNWLLRIYTSIFLILMPITLIENLNFTFSRNFQFYSFNFQIQLNLIVIHSCFKFRILSLKIVTDMWTRFYSIIFSKRILKDKLNLIIWWK